MPRLFYLAKEVKNLGEQTEVVQFGTDTLTIHYSVTLGDLLLSTLIIVFVSFYLVSWGHSLIFGRKK